ncbi:MAG: glycosyltransferase family 2 protein [Patescibacteria group bacterium]
MKLAIVIPAYNEEKTIANVVGSIPDQIDGVSRIETIVVDDNSSDRTYRIAKASGAHALSHAMNLGQGGAVLTGITYAKRLGADAVVTLDADGQHDPKEIGRLVAGYVQGRGEMIIGSRFLSESIKKMPRLKRFGNRAFSLITYLVSGKMLTDTQSGFRLFSSKMADALIGADLSGYEFCSETIMIAQKHRLSVAEVPISTIYDPNRVGGQSPINGINILLKLIYRKLVG